MSQLAFIFPTMLWLLLLLPWLWAPALLAPRRLPRARFWASLLLRTAAVAGLILALAGAQLVQPVGALTTVFLLDGSDSVALSQRARAEAFVQAALGTMPAGDRAALVVFGQRALVERPPAASQALGQVAAQPGGGATNVEDALRLGLALLPNEGRARLVLLSDGGETSGDARAAVQLVAGRGVPVDVLPLSGQADGLDAQVGGVGLPAAARLGQRLRLKIALESSAATDGQLAVVGSDGTTLASQVVHLPAGAQTFELVLPAAQPGFHRYIVRLDVPGDARPANNAAEAYTFVSGPPRVLLVEGQPGVAGALGRALNAAGLDVATVAAAQAPASLADLSVYDTVSLVNVPRRALAERTQAALSAYVHDLGRGLLMVGGDQSFGAGGWRGTPVEAALPVTMDIPAQVRLPAVGIVVLIDVSGSMGAEEHGRSKISLAAEGAQRVAARLRDDDELTVIMFDSAPQQVIGPLPGSRRDEAIDALSRTQAGGGGITMYDGLSEAARYIRQSDRPVRHIITITDGGDSVQQEGARDLVRQLRAEQVTLTSLAVGDGHDVPFLRDIAQIGGGRTFLTDQAANLPTLLADEAQAIIEPYIIEQEFTPTHGAPHPSLRGFDQTPRLKGYVVATPRASAQVLLSTPRGDPLLAAWQYGLGRSLAFTSDLSTGWGADWARWPELPRFSAQLLGWLLPQQSEQNLTLQSSALGAELVLTAQAQDALGRPITGLTIGGQLIATDTISAPVVLREVGPGRYRAAVSGAQPGVYLAQLVARDARGVPVGLVTAGVAVPQSAEYRSRGANPALLEALARASGGRLNIAPGQSFDPSGAGRGAVREIGVPLLWLALLLWPLDIALRRLVFTRRSAASLGNQARRTEHREPQARSRQPEVAKTQSSELEALSPKNSKLKAQSSELERLREAQERARRRARGEE